LREERRRALRRQEDAQHGGTYIATSASTAGSPPTAAIVRAYCSGVADAIMSIGFASPACAGRTPRSVASVSGASVGSSRPCASHASANRMPGPPAFVTTPTRRPAGTGCVDRRAVTSKSSSRVLVRITPACANSASTATSRLASAAEWLEAARVPAADRPDFTATIGFRRATSGAIRANFRGLPKLSR
jgi:hypothetical protein